MSENAGTEALNAELALRETEVGNVLDRVGLFWHKLLPFSGVVKLAM